MTVPTRVRVDLAVMRELKHGLRALGKALSRAAQLGGALELEVKKRKQLAAQQKQIVERYQALLDQEKPPAKDEVAEDEVYAARVAVKLRLGHLLKLRANELGKGVEANPDIDAKVDVLKDFALKVGVTREQLDVIEDAARKHKEPENEPTDAAED